MLGFMDSCNEEAYNQETTIEVKRVVHGMEDCRGHVHSAHEGAISSTVLLAPRMSRAGEIEEEL
jgi:hypothetical protein